ncbi:uncharacterized protein NPIL_467031 [Nephila pilipes]|uniref:Uncharacterized protein n=1 Tax=Nephila pilipes TaxID=299642 RepID=A0A8X6M7W8_NEPPI|nr:uncharacterized protein NPIL_467031 [Nephila pilipes]
MCYIELDVVEFAKTTGNDVILKETGPNSSVIARIVAYKLNETVSLKIASVKNSYIIMAFGRNVTFSECSSVGSHVEFKDGSGLQFCAHNTILMQINPNTLFSPNVSLTVKTEIMRLNFILIATVAAGNRVCDASEFRCGQSICIWKGFRCDGVNNCGDNSDESPGWPSNCAEKGTFSVAVFILFAALLFLALLIILIFIIFHHIMKFHPEALAHHDVHIISTSRSGSVSVSTETTGSPPQNDHREALETLNRQEQMLKRHESFEKASKNPESNPKNSEFQEEKQRCTKQDENDRS